ncbi:hypothetical protein [Ilumatobacter sp.]
MKRLVSAIVIADGSSARRERPNEMVAAIAIDAERRDRIGALRSG